MGQDAPKDGNLSEHGGQDGVKIVQDAAWLAILRPLGGHLGDFRKAWERSLQKGPKYRNEHHYGVLVKVVGGYFGRSWS